MLDPFCKSGERRGALSSHGALHRPRSRSHSSIGQQGVRSCYTLKQLARVRSKGDSSQAFRKVLVAF